MVANNSFCGVGIASVTRLLSEKDSLLYDCLDTMQKLVVFEC